MKNWRIQILYLVYALPFLQLIFDIMSRLSVTATQLLTISTNSIFPSTAEPIVILTPVKWIFNLKFFK